MLRRLLTLLLTAAVVFAGVAAVHAQSLDPARRVPRLTFYTTTPQYDPGRYEAALLIQEAFRLLGVDVDVRPIDQPVITSISRSEPWDYDGFFLSWGSQPERLDPHHYVYTLFHSSNLGHLGENRQGFNDPVYDAIAEGAAVSLDPEQRRAYVFQAQEYLADNVVIIPLWFNHLTQAYNKNRLDNVVAQPGLGLFTYNSLTRLRITQGPNVLRVAQRQDIDRLNPLTVVQNTDRQILDLIYDFLGRLDGDEVVPSTAESWRVIDNLTVEVKIRQGLTFHDGKPVTAHDVKFTWDYGKQVGFGRADTHVQIVDRVDLVDDYTVVFHLKEPYGAFINAAFISVPILPKHIWETVENPTQWNNPNPIGSGPFSFGYWRRGEELRLNRFAGYYAPANVDGILQIVYANPDAIVGAMELGDVDLVVPQLTLEQEQLLKQNSHVAISYVQGSGWTYFAYNLRRQPFADLAFRKAMAHVIDTALITETILEDLATPAGPGQVVPPSAGYWYNPDVTRYEFDPDLARRILAEAGYQWDSAGRLYLPAQ